MVHFCSRINSHWASGLCAVSLIQFTLYTLYKYNGCVHTLSAPSTRIYSFYRDSHFFRFWCLIGFCFLHFPFSCWSTVAGCRATLTLAMVSITHSSMSLFDFFPEPSLIFTIIYIRVRYKIHHPQTDYF